MRKFLYLLLIGIIFLIILYWNKEDNYLVRGGGGNL